MKKWIREVITTHKQGNPSVTHDEWQIATRPIIDILDRREKVKKVSAARVHRSPISDVAFASKQPLRPDFRDLSQNG